MILVASDLHMTQLNFRALYNKLYSHKREECNVFGGLRFCLLHVQGYEGDAGNLTCTLLKQEYKDVFDSHVGKVLRLPFSTWLILSAPLAKREWFRRLF